MDFSLSEIQKMLRTEARDFLGKECPSKLVREMEEDDTGYPAELWRQMALLSFSVYFDGSAERIYAAGAGQ